MPVAVVETVMAQLVITDLDQSVKFYESVFDRGPDDRPMDGLAEWHFDRAGGVQVFEEADRAGRSGVTISVSSLDRQLAVLDAAGIAHDSPMNATFVRLVTLSDPDGNRVVFTEPLSQGSP